MYDSSIGLRQCLVLRWQPSCQLLHLTEAFDAAENFLHMQAFFQCSLFCCKQLKPYRRVKYGGITQDMTLTSPLKVDHPHVSCAVYQQVVVVEVTMCDADVCWKH